MCTARSTPVPNHFNTSSAAPINDLLEFDRNCGEKHCRLLRPHTERKRQNLMKYFQNGIPINSINLALRNIVLKRKERKIELMRTNTSSWIPNIVKSLNYPNDLHVLVEKKFVHAHLAFGSANRRITLPCLEVPVSLGSIYTGP